MDQRNSYSDVYEALSEVIALRAIPLGAAAKLSFAAECLSQTGDSERALLSGRASVAILRLEHAIRDDDAFKKQRIPEDLGAILEQWAEIPLAEAGLLMPSRLAA